MKPADNRSVCQDLVYEKWKELGNAEWTVIRTKNSVTFKTYLDIPDMARLAYTIGADSVQQLWLTIVQRRRGVTDLVVLHIPLAWLPDSWVDEFKEMMAACLLVKPVKVAQLSS